MASPEDRTPPVYHNPPGGTWTAADAALTWCLAVGSFVLLGVLTGGGLGGLVAAQLVALAALPVAAVRARGLPLATLGLVRPPARAAVGAALVGASLWYVAATITVPWAELVGDRGEAAEPIERLIAPAPVAALVLLSLVPAVCEELTTRGLLVLGLRHRLGGGAAVAIAAVAFAALHLSLVRALPTAILGVALGVITLRAGSVVPAMIGHALNNAAALVIGAGFADPVARVMSTYPLATLGVMSAMCLAGLGIAWTAAPSRS